MTAPPIVTERLRLVPATVEVVEFELSSPENLAAALGVRVPDDWPPSFHTDKVLEFTADALRAAGAGGWWLHYFTIREEPLLIGTGGFKGPPDADGTIEIGYSIVPSMQRRGYATEAAKGLIAVGFERGASVVRAETLPSLLGSIRVMEGAGMEPVGAAREGVIAYEIPRPS